MDGSFLVGARAVKRPATFRAINPATNEALEPPFAIATVDDVAQACDLADEAFDLFRELAPARRAEFLEEIAAQIDALGDALVDRAAQETGLPGARLLGERSRTTGQLRHFARVLREGRWADVTLAPALPDRQPLPRPDLRLRRIAVGPVAVFGASNFPLAFSVGGGDTAAALAAGCPVVAKAHSAHPGTSAMVGGAIQQAVAACNLHEGTFSLLQGSSHELGGALVADPRIKAVGFTGSRAGGLALISIAQGRPEPIPVYGEMSSINPVLLFPGALASHGDALARAYVASLTMGAGQFCTNPGVILAVDGPPLDSFLQVAASALAAVQPQVMLTPTIHESYERGVQSLARHFAVEIVAEGLGATGCNQGVAAILTTTGAEFVAHPELAHEVFGAASLVVRCESLEEVKAVLKSMEGQLTATLHVDDADLKAASGFLPLLERKAGRILANAWPTGVEVAHAMVHGGPFPATSDSRSTSVGAKAIERFLRPVCYQDLPDRLLPAALQDANPLGLPRHVS